jgi:hypothetical protein
MRQVVYTALLASALLLAGPAGAGFHQSRIDEAMYGVGNDPYVGFVEIRMQAPAQTDVAGTRLTVFSCFGGQPSVMLDVQSNVPNGGTDVRWLMGSQSVAGAFVFTFGIEPDFWFAEGNIDHGCGNVCWGAPGTTIPENPPTWDHEDPESYVDCLAFGGYPGPFKTGQPVVTGPIYNDSQSLQRTGGTTYELTCPTPQNNAGQVGSLAGCTTTTTTSTSTTTLPPGPGIPVDGRKLSLRDDPADAAKRKATVLSKDTDLSLGGGNGSGDDPRASGATVRIVSAAGDGFDHTYPLPASGWRLVGREGENKGYRYADSSLAHGPVKSAMLKRGRLLKLSARGSGLGHTLGTNPNPVDVVVTIGGLTYCQRYGGATVFRPSKTYTAKLAAADACPP